MTQVEVVEVRVMVMILVVYCDMMRCDGDCGVGGDSGDTGKDFVME